MTRKLLVSFLWTHVHCWYIQVDIDMIDPDGVFSLRSLNDGGQTVRSADGLLFYFTGFLFLEKLEYYVVILMWNLVDYILLLS